MSNSAHESARLRLIAKLRAEHQDLLTLLTSYSANRETQTRGELIKTICIMTHLHYTVELGVFCCALEPRRLRSNLMNEATEGYSRAIALANEITGLSLDDALRDSTIDQLRDEILLHIRSTEAANGPFALSSQVDVDWDVVEREVTKRRLMLGQSMARNAR
jgi:hypothetical protein